MCSVDAQGSFEHMLKSACRQTPIDIIHACAHIHACMHSSGTPTRTCTSTHGMHHAHARDACVHASNYVSMHASTCMRWAHGCMTWMWHASCACTHPSMHACMHPCARHPHGWCMAFMCRKKQISSFERRFCGSCSSCSSWRLWPWPASLLFDSLLPHPWRPRPLRLRLSLLLAPRFILPVSFYSPDRFP
jgi:hypothetical protein